MSAIRIVAYGDTTVAAPRCQRGWAEHLYRPGREIAPVPVRGGRLLDAARGAASVVRLWAPWQVLVLQFGIFDARGGGTPPREVEALLRQTIGTLVHGGPVLVLAPIPPVAGCTVSGFGREARRWIDKNAGVWQRVVDEHHPAKLLTVTMPDGELIDRAWPSPAGHMRIATEIESVLSFWASTSAR